ncbi:MAG: hypothetical protein ABJA16_11925 [Nakamurella sp.]
MTVATPSPGQSRHATLVQRAGHDRFEVEILPAREVLGGSGAESEAPATAGGAL